MIGDRDLHLLAQVAGQLVECLLTQAGAGAVLLPLMTIEKTAGIEPGKLLLHGGIQPLAKTAARVATLILRPEAVQHESQLPAALLSIGRFDGAVLR
ncbi:hypothetical protein D3C79_844910 [compost metagenome]